MYFPALFRDAAVSFRSGSPVVSASARRDLTDIGYIIFWTVCNATGTGCRENGIIPNACNHSSFIN